MGSGAKGLTALTVVSLIEAGDRDGLGYRDTVQDMLAVTHSIPVPVEERLEAVEDQERWAFEALGVSCGRRDVHDCDATAHAATALSDAARPRVVRG